MFKLKKIAVAVGVAVLAISAGTAQAARIDPFGLSGGGGSYDVNNFGWNNGNSISAPIDTANGTVKDTAVGDTIQTYGMAKLQGLNDMDGNSFVIPGFNPNTWSYVFSFPEVVVTAVDALGSSSRVFRTIASPGTLLPNTFEIWVGGSPAVDLTGKGFNGDGGAVRILQADVLPYDASSGVGQTSFNSSSVSLVTLDQNGVDNYAGYSTATGTGGGKLGVQVKYVDPAYFLDNGALLDLVLITDTFQNLPYSQVNPASCFWNIAGAAYFDGTGNGIPGGCGVVGDGGTVSLMNAVYTGPGDTFTNVIFQTRATTTLPTIDVPEPGSLALLGIGLLSGVVFRRRKEKV